MESLPTIDEYLALKDWKFTPDIEQGQHEDYYWFRSDNFLFDELPSVIRVPLVPFQVVVTCFDGFGGGAFVYSDCPGWRVVGDLAVANKLNALPELFTGADNAQVIIDRENSDELILENFEGFEESSCLVDLEIEDTREFWNKFKLIDPYIYFSMNLFRRFTIISRGIELHQSFMNNIDWPTIEEFHRKSAQERCAALWADLGPERGPEKCVENGCERLRIPLAIRCFMHQLR